MPYTQVSINDLLPCYQSIQDSIEKLYPNAMGYTQNRKAKQEIVKVCDAFIKEEMMEIVDIIAEHRPSEYEGLEVNVTGEFTMGSEYRATVTWEYGDHMFTRQQNFWTDEIKRQLSLRETNWGYSRVSTEYDEMTDIDWLRAERKRITKPLKELMDKWEEKTEQARLKKEMEA